jgi:hypothetical protein
MGLGTAFMAVFNVIAKIFAPLAIIWGVISIITGVITNKLWPIFKGIGLIIGGILLFFGGWIAVIGAVIIGIVTLLGHFKIVRQIVGGIVDVLWKLVQTIVALFTLDWKSIGKIWSGGWSWNKIGSEFDKEKGAKKMAEGGIVTSRTRAIIGEAGPEAVIPLDKLNGMGGTINYNPTINVSSNGVIDVNDIVRRVNQGLYDELRRVGIR